MSATAALSKTFTVGNFTVEVSMPPLQHGEVSMAVAEWSPYRPLSSELSADDTEAYLLQLQEFTSAAMAKDQK